MDFGWMPGVASWAGFIYLLRTKVNNKGCDIRHKEFINPRLDRLEAKIDKVLDHYGIEKD